VSWAYNIADRIGTMFPSSVVVTGWSTVRAKPYRIVELTPSETRVNFGLTHALKFNARYTFATFRALDDAAFDIVHHVLPFAIGKTFNLAAIRRGVGTPFVIGPVQPPLTAHDADLDPTDFKRYGSKRERGLAAVERSVTQSGRRFLSDTVAPTAFSGISRATVRRAAALVAVNAEARACLIRSGASPSRIAIIPPGVDTSRFEPRVRLRATPGRCDLLSVSQLIKRKNLAVVIEAFAKLAETAPESTLRIVGDGPEREALTALAYRLGVGEAVTFTGFVPNALVHEEYHGAEVFINASASEGFATTCLEALASGLPVVSTRVGGFVDAVENGRNGYLVDAPNADMFAATLAPLVEDKALVGELSRRARETAERRFDWDRSVIPAYLEVYARVVARRRPATMRP
jgi:glycosyltransferase involved in cell wall biosynthesis